MKKTNRKGPKTKADFQKSQSFYEELTILKAQDLIAELMEKENKTKADLARNLGQSKAHVTDILSEDRNLTLKTLAKVCFQLGSEVEFSAKSIRPKCEFTSTYVVHIMPSAPPHSSLVPEADWRDPDWKPEADSDYYTTEFLDGEFSDDDEESEDTYEDLSIVQQ